VLLLHQRGCVCAIGGRLRKRGRQIGVDENSAGKNSLLYIQRRSARTANELMRDECYCRELVYKFLVLSQRGLQK
jgi:hypothetical protein